MYWSFSSTYYVKICDFLGTYQHVDENSGLFKAWNIEHQSEEIFSARENCIHSALLLQIYKLPEWW